LNRTGELAEWDLPALGKLLESLEAQGALDGVGFDEKEFQGVLDAILAEQIRELNQDEIPEPPDAATTRRGDIWILGQHRLMCGDSANSADVALLLAGAPIHLVNMDPPYNVKVEPRSNNAIAAGLSSFSGTSHHQALDLARHPEKARPTSKMRPKDRPLQGDGDARLRELISAGHRVETQESVDERARLSTERARLETVIANIIDNIDPGNRAIANDRLMALEREKDAVTRRIESLERLSMSTDEIRSIAHTAWTLISELPLILNAAPPETRITAVRKCITSTVLDSQERTAVLDLYREPGGSMRTGTDQ
jgi:hypothetical protein